MRHSIIALITLILTAGLSLNVHAHRAWLLPSATVLSGDDAWVSIDAAVSNDIFHADHVPMQIQGLVITAPDGKAISAQNAITAKFRSTFDVPLAQKGTYKIAVASSGIMARWETDKGERGMWPARGEQANMADFDKKVPKNAKNLEVSQFSRRIETFVTSGAPNQTIFKPTGKGLELVPITHPNDLFSGETAQFQFLIDGKVAVGTKLLIIPGGMRYRNQQDAIELIADAQGKIQIKWPKAGMYWLSANYRDAKANKPATARVGNYAATLEVLPE
jgi:uncharacterized GH25 family protein